MLHRIFALCLLVGLFCGVQAQAEILHYTDSRGKKVFVDSVYKVPPQYRDQLSEKKYRKKQFTQQQRQQLSEDESKLNQSFQLSRQIRRLEAVRESLTTKVRFFHRQAILPVTINYRGKEKVYQLLLDTGATYTMLHASAIGTDALRGADKAQAIVAGGGIIDVYDISADSVSVGPYRFEQSRVSIAHSEDRQIDGLLGMNVLSHLDYKIDYARGVIVWRESKFDEVIERISKLREQIEEP
ncbi:MAG: retropepsin-like aspartic protease [Pseudomonadales bacterium]